jgi:hypothetical protein
MSRFPQGFHKFQHPISLLLARHSWSRLSLAMQHTVPSPSYSMRHISLSCGLRRANQPRVSRPHAGFQCIQVHAHTLSRCEVRQSSSAHWHR